MIEIVLTMNMHKEGQKGDRHIVKKSKCIIMTMCYVLYDVNLGSEVICTSGNNY